ncbi:MAG TPA: YggT family protein [Candidatus Dormibacteraeota bacterium]|nr:YggT family protein [Candidatus Dormibacteraeota bacterium]
MERRETEVQSDPVTGTVREERHVTTGPAEEPIAPPVSDTAEVVSSFDPARRGVELIYLIFGIINGLLLIRLMLKLLGANPQAGFTQFVYNVSAVFLGPFRNLLPTVGNAQAQLETSVIVAIIVYALIGMALARLITIMFSRNVSVSRRTRTSGLKPRGY